MVLGIASNFVIVGPKQVLPYYARAAFLWLILEEYRVA